MQHGLRALLGRRVFVALLVIAWIPFVARSLQIYAVTTYPATAQVLALNMRLFQDFVALQGFFAFFVTVYAGAGLIATDRRARALQIYLSKPLVRMEYVAGKFGILAIYLASVTLLPSLLLILMQVALSGSLEFVRANPALVPAVVLASLIRVIVPAVTMLALSALSTSSRYVAVMYAGVIFFSEALYGVLRVVTGSTRVAWISITGNFDVVTDAIFQQTPRYDAPVAVSALVLIGLVVVSLSVLDRRVRGVEVVS
jgi:hypothetical protein